VPTPELRTGSSLYHRQQLADTSHPLVPLRSMWSFCFVSGVCRLSLSSGPCDVVSLGVISGAAANPNLPRSGLSS